MEPGLRTTWDIDTETGPDAEFLPAITNSGHGNPTSDVGRHCDASSRQSQHPEGSQAQTPSRVL
jgi:hypothetical protein